MAETLEQMVARINSCAFIGDLDSVYAVPKRTRKPSKLQRAILALDSEERALLLQLLQGSYRIVEYRREPFAVKQDGAVWRVRSLAAGAAEHTVEGDRCSCPDSRFRERPCRHCMAVRKVATDV